MGLYSSEAPRNSISSYSKLFSRIFYCPISRAQRSFCSSDRSSVCGALKPGSKSRIGFCPPPSLNQDKLILSYLKTKSHWNDWEERFKKKKTNKQIPSLIRCSGAGLVFVWCLQFWLNSEWWCSYRNQAGNRAFQTCHQDITVILHLLFTWGF